MTALLIQGDARALPLRAETVQCVVTSPPYWSLRDYGLPRTWWGGVQGHQHEAILYKRQDERYSGRRRWQHIGAAAKAAGVKVREFAPEAWVRGTVGSSLLGGRTSQVEAKQGQISQRDDTGEGWCDCGAWLGCLGLEPTPDLYVEHLVTCLREVRRVLRNDGTLWLNLGDSYAGARRSGGYTVSRRRDDAPCPRSDRAVNDLKPKDLVGVPWRVAFALQADGWWLRSDLIWSKPNPMPESVTDRPTRAHEYLFLLAKSERYFYDASAIREHGRGVGSIERTRRSVWEIATAPYPQAHFATFPPDLVRPCVLAGSRRGDVVLDPFGGTGTVAQVAAQALRNVVIVEPSRDYLRLASARLARFGQPVSDARPAGSLL